MRCPSIRVGTDAVMHMYCSELKAETWRKLRQQMKKYRRIQPATQRDTKKQAGKIRTEK